MGRGSETPSRQPRALPPGLAAVRIAPLLALALIVAGCSGISQRAGQHGPPKMSPNASDVTVYRARAPSDSFFYMFVLVDGVQVTRLDEGERFSFSLEPGTYVLGYSLEATDCGKKMEIEARRSYVFRLAPSCAISLERAEARSQSPPQGAGGQGAGG
jgi:hypothetical protein